MTISEKLSLWAKISGVNPDETSFVIKCDGHLSSWDIKEMHTTIKGCLETDVDGFMTNILLRKFTKKLLADRQFTVSELLHNSKEITDYLTDCKRLEDAVNISQAERDEYNRLCKLVQKFGYSYDLPDISDDDFMYKVCTWRISVNKKIDSLMTAQFRKGDYFGGEPQLMSEIYLATNINSLIARANSMGNAIFLSFIRDTADAASSYFAYCIKNGENVFIIADVPARRHPMEKHMRRTAGRDMDERISQTLLPYSLVNMKMSKYAVDDSELDGVDLVGKINELPYDELIWNIFMIQKIEEKFFKNHYQCEELSYTGHMIDSPLLEVQSTEIAIYQQYERMSLPVIKNLEETNDVVLDYPLCHTYDTYIQRLGSMIDVVELQNFDTDILKTPKDIPWYEEEEQRRNTLLTMPINDYGTKEELVNRQKWIVRYNYALKLKELAKQECEEHRKEVLDWYYSKIKEKYNLLIDRILKKDMLETHQCRCIMTNETCKESTAYEVGNQRVYRLQDYRCVLTGEHAVIELQVFPQTAKDIADVLSCDISDLPVYIQDYGMKKKTPSGNHLLNTCDPIGFVMEDVWEDSLRRSFSFSFYLSKTAYNERRKELGLEPDKFWLKKSNKTR